MIKKIVLITSAVMAMGLLGSFTSENRAPITRGTHTDLEIQRISGNYSRPSHLYKTVQNVDSNINCRFHIYGGSEETEIRDLVPNKEYTLTDMQADDSYAEVNGTKIAFSSASIIRNKDENEFYGYSVDVTLVNGDSYSYHEAAPKSGEMVIDKYQESLQGEGESASFTLTDTDTSSTFEFYVNSFEEGKTYQLSDMDTEYFTYCAFKDRYRKFKSVSFTRNVNENGYVYCSASIISEHGDKLDLTYDATPVAVTGVILDKTSITLKAGESETLVATVSPENATDKGVTWESSNEEVATVDENGLIQAINPGIATITVTTKDGNFTATCEVEVLESASTVTAKINALPSVEEVTLEDKDAVESVRGSYDSLDGEEQAKIEEEVLNKLIALENKIAELEKQAADWAAVNAFIDLMEKLPDEENLTLEHKAAVEAARAAYDSLTQD